jgi:RimJ/RimL family protein N-acetyltransferase
MGTLDTLAGTVTISSKPTPSVRVIPYNSIYDPQSDAFLPYMWKRMQKDDLVDYYFPGQKDTGFASFARLMSGDGNVALVVTDSDSRQWDQTIAGFITWTSSRMGSADIAIAGFIFFREFWDHKTTDEAARVSFDYWFGESGFQTVLGVCPSLHHAAIQYNRRIGLREIGRIPGAHLYKGVPCDAILYALTKEEWSK